MGDRTEGYQPSPEEMSKAEEIMTESEREISLEREFQWLMKHYKEAKDTERLVSPDNDTETSIGEGLIVAIKEKLGFTDPPDLKEEQGINNPFLRDLYRLRDGGYFSDFRLISVKKTEDELEITRNLNECIENYFQSLGYISGRETSEDNTNFLFNKEGADSISVFYTLDTSDQNRMELLLDVRII